MRDLNAMAEALRNVWMQGHGIARRLPACPKGFTWFAGAVRLNGQAVMDLMADGWLFTEYRPDEAKASGVPAWMIEGEF